MLRTTLLISILTATAGCTSSTGRTYQSQDWKPGQSLGKVLVVVPQYSPAATTQPTEKDAKIHTALRDALKQTPGTTVIDQPMANSAAPVSESGALEAARTSSADTVCILTVGEFGGRYLVTLWPPGWDSHTNVQYSLRLIDVKSGHLLLDSVRHRSAGGYLAIMTATYPEDLKADLTSVLSSNSR